MTKNSTKRWKVVLLVSIAAILLVAVAGLNLFDPKAQAQLPLGNQCGVDRFGQEQQIFHFDKIIFENKHDLLNARGGEVEKGSIMDIKVLDDPARIEFPMKKAVQKLNDASWTNDDGEPVTLKDLKLIDVEYAIICVSIGE